MKQLFPITAFAAACLGIGAAQAEPAIVYDMGGKFDKSFNEAAYRGMERWKKDTGKNYLEFEIANESQREQAMRRMAERGASPIIGVGFSQASSIEKVAKDFPKLQFAMGAKEGHEGKERSEVCRAREARFLDGM
jgi:basic membrane protein A